MTLQTEFSDEVEAFLKAAAISPSRFGRDVLGDPGFVAALRRGRCPNLRTIERARAFINAWRAA